MIAFRGQKKVGPRPHWSPLRVSFNISDEHPRVFGLLSSRNFASIGALITLGTRGFSRVRREFSVLTEGRHIFGRRPKPQAAIKTWQKPETVLEKSLAPRVCPHLLAKFESGNKEDMSRGNCCFTSMLCLSHKNIDKKVGRSVGWWKLILPAWSMLYDTSTDITNEYRATHTTVSCNDCGGQSTVMKKDAPTSLSHSAFLFPCFHS